MSTTHQKFKNNAKSTLNGTLAIGGTTINLPSGHGNHFPTPSAGEYVYVTLYEKDGSGNEITYEIVEITGITGDALTVVRDIEGLVVAAGGTSGGWAYPSSVGVNPSQVVYIELRYTAFAAGNNLTKDGNLEGMENYATARANMGLGSMALQAASSVAITGGTIAGVAITGATITATDSLSTFADNSDATKQMRFELSGLTTSSTRIVTIRDTNLTMAGQDVANTFTQPQTFSSTINKVTITQPASGSTLTIADGKTLTASADTILGTNSITFAGTEVLTLTAAKNVTFADSFTTAGAYSQILRATAATDITLPTTGTLATLAGSEALTNKTINGNTITASTATLTLPAALTVAFANAFSTIGAFAIALTATGATALTLPTSGTLATTAGTVALAQGLTGTPNITVGTLTTTGNTEIGNGGIGVRLGVTQTTDAITGYIYNTSASLTNAVLLVRGDRNTTNGTWKFVRFYNGGAGVDKFSVDDGGNTVVGGTATSATPANSITSGVAQMKSGTWTPSATSLTTVGSPTFAGTYTRVNDRVTITLTITPGTSTASTLGTTYFTGLPYTCLTFSAVIAMDQAATLTSTPGMISSSNNRIFTPTWGAATSIVVVTGTYTTSDAF